MAERLVSSLLGLAYIASGSIKLWRFILPSGYDFMAEKFVEYAQVYPTRPLGYTPEPGFYMSCVGYIELTLGVCLILAPRLLKRLACLGLMFIMIGAAQTLIFNKEYVMVLNPTIFFFALYWVHSQLAPKPKTD